MISSNFLLQIASLSSSNFIANEILSLQSSYLRLTSDFHATGFKLENLEKAYRDAIEKLTGMLQRQVQTQKDYNNLGCLTSDGTPTTGRSPYFQNDTVDSDYGNYYYGIGNDISEAFIYEEEDCFSDSCDEDYFTTEEFSFDASILDPTFSEICLPSAFPDTFDFEISMKSNSLISYRPSIVYYYRLHFQEFSISSKSLSNIADFFNRLSVKNLNHQYKIYFWDPGTFFFYILYHLYFTWRVF